MMILDVEDLKDCDRQSQVTISSGYISMCILYVH